ncbi:MAG: cyclic nucleotide-binding domain-containing protein [Burkholderiales bacterium]|nr:cyclic nucleotide-binding domain-containing protein [Burkholderiales bacterium]
MGEAAAFLFDLGQFVPVWGYHPWMDQGEACLNQLRQAYLFAGVPEDQLSTLLKTAHEVELGAGEMLFTQGQHADRFFFVREGMLKLFRVSSEGDEKIIEITQPGQTFAEAVMFMGTNSRYPVNAEALYDSRLLAFQQRAFHVLLENSKETCFGMLASMSRRLHMLVNQIDSLTLQNATYRLVSYLLEQMPHGVQESPEIVLTTPKSAIAARLAIQPETLSRILKKLSTKGLIEVHGNHIVVSNVGSLRSIVQAPPSEHQ